MVVVVIVVIRVTSDRRYALLSTERKIEGEREVCVRGNCGKCYVVTILYAEITFASINSAVTRWGKDMRALVKEIRSIDTIQDKRKLRYD